MTWYPPVVARTSPVRRFTTPELERMRYYERGCGKQPDRYGWHLSLDREGQPLALYSDGQRFVSVWRPLRMRMSGLWFWSE